MASDVRVLRDVLVGVGREPAVVGITVAQIEYERRVTDKAVRERDEARAERDLARKQLHLTREALGRVRGERDQARAEAARWKEAVGDLTAGDFESWEGRRTRAGLAAERDRYREALEQIATGRSGTAPDPLPLSRWEQRSLAKAALRGGDGHE